MNADKLAEALRLLVTAHEEVLGDGLTSFNEPVELRRAKQALAAHDAQPEQADKTLIVNMDQAAAWRAVADALTEVSPGWLRGDGTGMECAVAAIKRLAQPAQAAQPVGVADGWREFITRVANQGPSKPDYWSTCAQCERNTSDAEDLLTAAPPPPAQPSADAEDAARYRWLTNHCFDESLFNESEDKCEVDSRIDAARAAEGRS